MSHRAIVLSNDSMSRCPDDLIGFDGLVKVGIAIPVVEPGANLLVQPAARQGRVAEIEAVVVDMAFEDLEVAPGAALVQLALIADNVDTVATTLTQLEAHDAKGSLELTARDVKGATFEDVNLAGTSIVDANIEGLTINGHDIAALLRMAGGKTGTNQGGDERKT